VEVNRIGPDGGFVKKFNKLEESIKSVQTAPAGNIVIRDTLTTTDPVTGVKTILSPSGGLQQWVGDIEPPAKPSTPIVTPHLGVFSIYWDGVGFLGEVNPPDYDRTDIEMSTLSEGPWFKVGELRGEGSVQVTDQAYNETRYFRLVSYDVPGNASVASDLASGMTTPIVDEESIRGEIDRIDQDLTNAQTDITGLSEDYALLPGRLDELETTLAPLPGQLSELEADLAPLPDKIAQIEIDLEPLPGQLAQLETDLAEVPGQIAAIEEEIAPYPQMISDAAASVITDARLVEGSLTKWPFQGNTIPSGAFAPGAVRNNDIADFSLAVTKLKSNRHQIY
jgi:hypothetical protein